jgi:hypothetical protein
MPSAPEIARMAALFGAPAASRAAPAPVGV